MNLVKDKNNDKFCHKNKIDLRKDIIIIKSSPVKDIYNNMMFFEFAANLNQFDKYLKKNKLAIKNKYFNI